MLKLGGLLLVSISLWACSHTSSNSIEEYNYSPNYSENKGKRLTVMMCGGCHYNQLDKALTGKRLSDLPWYVGEVYSANITNQGRIADQYTDDQIGRLIRHGLLLDGSISRFMGTPQISKSDLESIVSYLRSSDELVRPIDTVRPKSKFSIFAKLYFWLRGEKTEDVIQDQIGVNGVLENENNTNNGKYLVSILECYACHSSSISKINRQIPEDTPGYMKGGTVFISSGGIKIKSANITADPETGIGHWSLSQFVKAMREGEKPDRIKLRVPMPKYTGLSDAELADIFKYIQSLTL